MAKHLPISFISVTDMTRTIENINPQYARRNTHDAIPAIWRGLAFGGRTTHNARRFTGSALILAIVLTSLLAIVGVIFLLSSRVESVATSSIAGNTDLSFAVDSVVSRISQDLAHDVPGVDPNFPQAYYDYPDGGNPWLACLEPYDSGAGYRWRHITDINNTFQSYQNLLDIPADINAEYQDSAAVGDSTPARLFPADADGDGVSDSIWVQVPDKVSAKGKPIYAAVRVIDNGGMLNVNTGYKFNTADSCDGSSQTQINFLALSALDHTHMPPWQPTDTRQDRLLSYRCGSADVNFYEPNVVWQYGLPIGAYTPFDISDELKLRNRYIINYNLITSRIETLWTNAFDGPPNVPRDTTIKDANWIWVVYNNYPSPCSDPNIYDNHHIATTYNLDRIINPAGGRMVNINTADANSIRDAIKAGLIDANSPGDVNGTAAQIAANLLDYTDSPDPNNPRYDPNNDVTVVWDDANPPIPHFGFEQPCIYISELMQSFYNDVDNEVNVVRHSFAIELYKPYAGDPLPDSNNKWQLIVSSDPIHPIPVVWPGNSPFFVMQKIDVNAPIDPNIKDSNEVNDSNVVFKGSDTIQLQRYVNTVGGFITVDEVSVPVADYGGSGWFNVFDDNKASVHHIERDISPHKCIRRLWATPVWGPLSAVIIHSSALTQI